MAGVTLTGDWKKAKAITTGMVPLFKVAARRATLAEAHYLRKKMIEGINSQAPGGKAFEPLAGSTMEARAWHGRGGTKALIVTAALRNSISVKESGNTVFVGILRSAQKGRANIAEINEYGATIAMRLTPKALRFLHAIGGDGPGASGIAQRPSGGGIGVAIIVIPPRPFVRPTVEAHAKPSDVKKRFERNLAIGMGFQLGSV